MNMLRDMLQPARRNMLRGMFTATSALTRFAVNGVEAALALDFIASEYRTANTSTTFADAFTGTSPKLTYSTSAGSNSTMVNSEGKIVWAPHNLVTHSQDFSQWGAGSAGTGTPPVITPDAGTAPDGSLGAYRVQMDLGGGTTSSDFSQLGTLPAYGGAGVDYTLSVWMKSYDGNSYDVMLDFNASAVQIETITNQWRLVSTTVLSLDTVGRPVNVARLRGGTGTSNTADILIYGAHVYRSDLGGMHPVPGADTGFEYYVPTNGSAEYLPRVGHHVYNGSTWVNEGLLIESEPRTNLLTYSDLSSGWDETGVDPIALDATGPDGQANTAVTLNEDNTTGEHKLSEFIAAVPASTYTSSVFVKLKPSDTRTKIRLQNSNFVSNNNHGDFDLSAGTVTKGSNADNATIQNVGNGWFRCSVTSTSTGQAGAFVTVYLLDASGNTSYTGDGTSGILIYGAQLDQGQVVNGTPTPAPTPSSYMPTNGQPGGFTRTAQSLTVPPAEFGWPEPEVIGQELVTDFSTYADQTAFDVDWTRGTGWTFSGGVAVASNVTPPDYLTQANAGLTDGAVYVVTFTISNYVSGRCNIQLGAAGQVGPNIEGNGTYSVIRRAALAGSDEIRVQGRSSFTATIDNVSVREINPLSVSIQMDGRMTYADEGVGVAADGITSQVVPFTWRFGASDYIYTGLSTSSTATGVPVFVQEASGTVDSVSSASPGYTPGVNVPFNISSRHGSTFIRGATDGVLTNLDTTPTALPDLSGTDLAIAYDFMGTIGTFRQFAGDIGDAGLVTATNPSTEPTLSLTFDGTDGSFYNLSWSE